MVYKQVQSGFTLLELLLVVVLLLLFAGVAVTNLAALRHGAQLREGVGQLETLLRFARAEASQQGRRMQVRLGGGLADEAGLSNVAPVRVSWEPQPLARPGVFVADAATAQLAQSVNNLVRIANVRHLDPANAIAPANAAPVETLNDLDLDKALNELDSTNTEMWQPIMFYPDGSSDSAEILVTSQDASDPRQMLVRWDGLSGSATHHEAAQETSPADSGNEPAAAARPLEPASVAHNAPGRGVQ